MTDSSPTFQGWVSGAKEQSPEGTAENSEWELASVNTFQPSLRDFADFRVGPKVETLGYSHKSLRDNCKSWWERRSPPGSGTAGLIRRPDPFSFHDTAST